MNTKVCRKCLIEKEAASCFTANPATKDKLQSICRDCKKQYDRGRVKNPEIKQKIEATLRKWKDSSPKYSAYHQQYYKDNKAKCQGAIRKWMDENREWTRGYKTRRKQIDPVYKLSEILRGRFTEAIKNNSKRGSAAQAGGGGK